jgi:hypothetical protein
MTAALAVAQADSELMFPAQLLVAARLPKIPLLG